MKFSLFFNTYFKNNQTKSLDSFNALFSIIKKYKKDILAFLKDYKEKDTPIKYNNHPTLSLNELIMLIPHTEDTKESTTTSFTYYTFLLSVINNIKTPNNLIQVVGGLLPIEYINKIIPNNNNIEIYLERSTTLYNLFISEILFDIKKLLKHSEKILKCYKDYKSIIEENDILNINIFVLLFILKDKIYNTHIFILEKLCLSCKNKILENKNIRIKYIEYLKDNKKIIDLFLLGEDISNFITEYNNTNSNNIIDNNRECYFYGIKCNLNIIDFTLEEIEILNNIKNEIEECFETIENKDISFEYKNIFTSDLNLSLEEYSKDNNYKDNIKDNNYNINNIKDNKDNINNNNYKDNIKDNNYNITNIKDNNYNINNNNYKDNINNNNYKDNIKDNNYNITNINNNNYKDNIKDNNYNINNYKDNINNNNYKDNIKDNNYNNNNIKDNNYKDNIKDNIKDNNYNINNITNIKDNNYNINNIKDNINNININNIKDNINNININNIKDILENTKNDKIENKTIILYKIYEYYNKENINDNNYEEVILQYAEINIKDNINIRDKILRAILYKIDKMEDKDIKYILYNIDNIDLLLKYNIKYIIEFYSKIKDKLDILYYISKENDIFIIEEYIYLLFNEYYILYILDNINKSNITLNRSIIILIVNKILEKIEEEVSKELIICISEFMKKIIFYLKENKDYIIEKKYEELFGRIKVYIKIYQIEGKVKNIKHL